jgi:hypothetical protein
VYPQRSLRRPRKNVHLGARTAARDSRVFSRLLPRSRDIENSHSDLGSQVGPDLMDTQKFARYHFSATVHTSDAGVLHSLIGLSQWAQCGEKHPQIAWAGCGEKHWRSRGGQTTVRFTSCERRTEWCAKAAELLSGNGLSSALTTTTQLLLLPTITSLRCTGRSRPDQLVLQKPRDLGFGALHNSLRLAPATGSQAWRRSSGSDAGSCSSAARLCGDS